MQNDAAVVSWAVLASSSDGEVGHDFAEGFIHVTPKQPRIARAVLTELLEKVQLGLHVPVLRLRLLSHDGRLQRAVAVSKPSASCCKFRTRRVFKVAVASS